MTLSTSEFPNLHDGLRTMEYRAWNGLDVQKFDSIQLGACLTDNLSNVRKHTEVIHGEFYDPVDFKSETRKFIKSLSHIDGSYAFAIPKDSSIVFARDVLGTKPLYYGYDSAKFLLATDGAALAVYGLQANTVIPGFLYQASLSKMKRVKFSTLQYQTKKYDITDAIEKTTKLLKDSIKRRVRGKKVVLGLGGGIDSSLLALLAKGSDITAVTVCTKDSLDYTIGRVAADILDIPHETVLIDENAVRNSIRQLQKITLLRNAMHASIACAVHVLALHTRKSGMDALMLGQLADELFGGYARYVRYLKNSTRKVKNAMFNDIKNAFRDNLERDEAASASYTKLLLPYTSLDFIKYALTIPLRMKINSSGARKIILREVGKKVNLPDALLLREKKAMQFSSGIYKLVSKMNL